MFIFLITFCLCFIDNLLYSRKSKEENIVGIWKHHKDQVFLIFREDNRMSLRIPLNFEVKGQYKFIEKQIMEVIFLSESFLIDTGEIIKSKPQIMKIVIGNNELILYGIDNDKLKGDLFNKVM